jgi:hypothetical protein
MGKGEWVHKTLVNELKGEMIMYGRLSYIDMRCYMV